MWDKRARITAVKDGDTVAAYVDDGRAEYAELDIRLFGTFAPELKGVGGLETKAYAAQWVAERSVGEWPFVVQMMRNKGNTREQITFGRYVWMVYTADLSECLNTAVSAYVVTQGYNGGTGAPKPPPTPPPTTQGA